MHVLQTDRQHSIESNIYSSGLNVHVLGSQKDKIFKNMFSENKQKE